ncbi:MAG TPA: tRNA-guanine transglycosylase DpdA [Burkholderiales bacterium]|nr:tRNA-guanine transglycosylase DpdA [Burkholderiales bacterium]
MKFLYSDTQDYVDPSYDFIQDRNAPGRKRYWDDVYAHELMTPAPYDGLLLSMSAIRQAPGVAKSKVRYSTAEEQRLRRDGARRFLRYGGPSFKDATLMGDCGAFAYVEHEKPAYSPEEVLEFYSDAGFTHGVSPDHIIFDCDLTNRPAKSVGTDVLQRYEITIDNARTFFKLSKKARFPFMPVGAVQGWSPESIARAARTLERIGYSYLAIGGLVPLKVASIHAVLAAVRDAIKPDTKLHLLGFAKADQIGEFIRYDVSSFDSTSPLIRAFKDARANYYLPSSNGHLDYYAAIRIPQAIENPRLMQGIKKGAFSAEDLLRREARALESLRGFDKGKVSLPKTIEAVTSYQHFLTLADTDDAIEQEKSIASMRQHTKRTLEDAPWKQCKCAVCSQVGVEVIIFRSSNRNKRRGFHNLGVYHKHLHGALEKVH